MSRPSSSRRNGSVVISSMDCAGREVLDVAGNRNRRGELEIGGQADGSVPAVGMGRPRLPRFSRRPSRSTSNQVRARDILPDRAKWPVREPQVISEAGIRKGAVCEPICRAAPRPVPYRNSSSCRR